jgi:hypothetical protein
MNASVPSRKFLVERGNQRGPKRCKGRNTVRILLKKFGERGAIRDFGGLFSASDKFAKAAKEKHLYMDRGRDGRHDKIVT